MSFIYNKFRYMNEYDIHKALINEYLLKYKGDTKFLRTDTSKDKKDLDVIKENHKFLWNDEAPSTWEEQLAKKYYDKLFREYCICDLSRYKENKVALRWRIEQEVVVGKGQFSCANKKCNESDNLKTWEVNFAYVEHSEKKNALVKVRLCEECSGKLNYHSQKREVKRLKKRKSLDKKKRKNKTDDKNKEDSNSDKEDGSKSDSKDAEENNDNDENSGNKLAENPETLWENYVPEKEKTVEEEMDDYLHNLFF